LGTTVLADVLGDQLPLVLEVEGAVLVEVRSAKISLGAILSLCMQPVHALLVVRGPVAPVVL